MTANPDGTQEFRSLASTEAMSAVAAIPLLVGVLASAAWLLYPNAPGDVRDARARFAALMLVVGVICLNGWRVQEKGFRLTQEGLTILYRRRSREVKWAEVKSAWNSLRTFSHCTLGITLQDGEGLRLAMIRRDDYAMWAERIRAGIASAPRDGLAAGQGQHDGLVPRPESPNGS